MPDSRFKIFWNLVTIVLLIYTAIFVPYSVAFSESEEKSMAQTVIDILFTIDIFINFLSGYEDIAEGKVVTDLKLIARTYVCSWFIPDVMACIPFGLFTPKGGSAERANSSKLIRLSRLPRLYRLIRILRMMKMIKILKNSEIVSYL